MLRLAGLCATILAIGAASAQAATISVTNGAGSGPGTLREAVETANGNANADTIAIQVELVQLNEALPDLVGELDIEGTVPGATVRGGGQVLGFRVFNVAAGAAVSISDLTVENGAGSSGAGINNAGTLSLDHVTVTGNLAEGFAVVGGAVNNDAMGTMTITDSSITNNQSVAEGFALGGGFASNGQATLVRTKVSENLMVVPAIGMSGSAYGAGIFNGVAGSMTLNESSVSDNTAVIGNQAGSAEIAGGGIGTQGGLTIIRSTIADNNALATTSNGAGSSAEAVGGGIGLLGGPPVTIISSTIFSNQALAGEAESMSAAGGGIGTTEATIVNLRSSTVSGNYLAGTASLGANVGGPIQLTVISSILADPSGDTGCEAVTTTTQGFNLDEDSSCIPVPDATDIQAVDPQLGPLANNGGPTQTLAIPNTSPAIDQGVVPGTGGDQRGTPRPADLVEVADAAGGDGSDIGAYEYQPSADLSVQLSDAPDPAITEGEVTYTLTVQNAGPDAAPDTTVEDTLPPGTIFLSATAGCGEGSGVVSCDLGVLAPGASEELTMTVRVGAPGDYEDTALVQSASADPNPADNGDSETTTVNPKADLSLALSDDPDPVFAGEEITYTVTAANAGPNSAADVTLEDTLGTETTFVSASAGCDHAAGVVSCDLGTVALGASPEVQIVVKAEHGGSPVNQASLQSSTYDPDSLDLSAQATTTVTPSADLAFSLVDSPDPAYAGEAVTHTLTVENLGPDTATNVGAYEELPAGVGLSFVSAPAGCEYLNEVVECALGSLASGSSKEIPIVLHADEAGEPAIEAGAASATHDPVHANGTALETTTIEASADLSLQQIDSPDPVMAGQAIAYTLTVHNAGPSPAEDVVVADTLPAGTAFAAGPGCAPAGATIECDFGALAAGSSASVTVTATTDASGSRSNAAMVRSSTHDPDAGNDASSESTLIQPRPLAPVAPSVDRKCGGAPATIVGTAMADTLKGTPRRDVIAGLGGNDRINGLGGNDLLCGEAGNDTLLGGRGNDKLLGGAGRDTVRGGPGKDALSGGPGKDVQAQ
jgi:uncharacterized repeat protein (TIGR01451 family)